LAQKSYQQLGKAERMQEKQLKKSMIRED